jgi:hypothetical protein
MRLKFKYEVDFDILKCIKYMNNEENYEIKTIAKTTLIKMQRSSTLTNMPTLDEIQHTSWQHLKLIRKK